MKLQFDKTDLKIALSKYARVTEAQIVISDGMPEIIATADAAQKPAKTGRLRGKTAPKQEVTTNE